MSALGLGCQDYLFEQKCPEAIKEAAIKRIPAEPKPADILFVVDNSGSMADDQMNLAANFGRFIQAIAGSGDYRIAVVSTDQSSSNGEISGVRESLFANDPYRYFTGFDPASTCQQTGIDLGCFLGPEANLRVVSSELEAAAQVSNFQRNVLVGSCGSGDERGLAGMISGLTQTNANGCNSNFLRDNANLVIVFVSDEEDVSQGPVANYVNQLRNLKPLEQVRVAAIVGSIDGRASNCRIDTDGSASGMCGTTCQNPPQAGSRQSCQNTAQCPNGETCAQRTCINPAEQYWEYCYWCSYYDTPDCCSALGGSRYIDFARAIEIEVSRNNPEIPVSNCRAPEGTRAACLVDSICQANFGDTLERIARDLVIVTGYDLNPPAINPAGVRARVNGPNGTRELVPGTDFTVNATGSELQLTAALQVGEKLDIYFVSELDKGAPAGACGTSTTP